ncbi:MAG: HAD-IC family P-type ATPase [Oscillospiraceae bacterium]|jgi:cation-transporting ATPase E|nr:HAD-IC family P-type ATPase [Oscillospiraceae bacterium]
MQKYTTKRYFQSPSTGLSSEQVKKRIEENLQNIKDVVPTKTISQILKENFLTLFNIINFILAFMIIIVGGSYKNILFMGVVLCNTTIGVLQELRAKKAVDDLSLLSMAKSKVIRNSKKEEIDVSSIVLDDILLLEAGDQVPTDCIVCEGICEANESLITGESNSIFKKNSDFLLSGSYLVSGTCKAKVENIGEENYISKISKDAKKIENKTNSEISKAFRKIIFLISFLIIPIGIFLFFKQINLPKNTLVNATEKTVGALIGMVPEGLVLLTSTVLAVGVLRLSRKKVLVQDLYCIETLARVDTLCLDKTGTITEGSMEVVKIIEAPGQTEEDLRTNLEILSSNLEDKNPTIIAIKSSFPATKKNENTKIAPFSSEKKWSGLYNKNVGSIVLGAPEFVLKKDFQKFKSQIEKYILKNRVLVVAKSSQDFTVNNDSFSLPEDLKTIGFVLLKDKVRTNAKKTLEYFKEQGVDLKIISGDNVKTIENIAGAVGFEVTKSIDMTTVSSKRKLKEAAINCNIFGRVSPLQKKQLVIALKEKKRTVAMTGDGVNDVLALKESDCSIAMASGSEAARNISKLVLLKSDFSAMPQIVNEGRRSVNNIQRSSSLFLVKTIYSLLLGIIFLFLKTPYPFVPIQMTLITSLTIGIPSFFLALEPNKEKIKGKFLLNTVGKALPGAVTVVINIFILSLLSYYFSLEYQTTSTISAILTGFVGFLVLFKVCLPFNNLRKILFLSTTICFLLIFIFNKTNNLFNLENLNLVEIVLTITLATVCFLIFKGIIDTFDFLVKKKIIFGVDS